MQYPRAVQTSGRKMTSNQAYERGSSEHAQDMDEIQRLLRTVEGSQESVFGIPADIPLPPGTEHEQESIDG